MHPGTADLATEIRLLVGRLARRLRQEATGGTAIRNGCGFCG